MLDVASFTQEEKAILVELDEGFARLILCAHGHPLEKSLDSQEKQNYNTTR